uniref:EF-hand domain-containing protein n=1 Tax=Leersia perrieri TaxID=77586 RepID=A0A0D9VV71_9ORYZ
MGVTILDGSTLRDFVADDDTFTRKVDARFDALDADRDGLLSRAELARTLKSFRLLDGAGFGYGGGFYTQRPAAAPFLPAEVASLYDSVLNQFDAKAKHSSGYVDRAGFIDEMRRIMVAVADRLESHPLRVSIQYMAGTYFFSEDEPDEDEPVEYVPKEYDPVEYEPIEPEPRPHRV